MRTPKKCRTPIGTIGKQPVPCGEPVAKAGMCAAHYLDWKHAKESRRGTERVNPERRAKTASGLTGRQWVRARKAARRAGAA